MKIEPTYIAGVSVATTSRIADHRGAFTRFFCAEELAPLLGVRRILQVNHSRTASAGAIRGLHYQRAPHAEMKFVRCLKGRVLDIALDLRKDSPTFLKFHAEELEPDTARMLVIPEGCAHGFQVLEPGSELLYLHTAFYNRESEGGVKYDDPAVGIPWPLPAADLSARDQAHPPIDASFKGLTP